jgi:glycosyltransferase involved in cell wall biosynthesis
MREIDLRSIRILVDLQACQTGGSAQRGVGRYSAAFFEAMAKVAAPRDLFGLLGTQHPTSPALDKFRQERVLRADVLPDWRAERSFHGGEQDTIDSHLLAAVTATASPDVVHISHIFEGFSDRVAVPNVLNRPAGQVLSATLYDLIPLRFKAHYFQSPEFERWYYHRMKFYRQADLLLSISESSRRDAIELLGLAPSKIVTIHGGISDHFQPVTDSESVRLSLQGKYALKRPGIVLYTGGDDHRKNLTGAIEAYAALSPALRKTHQLVIICAIEPHREQLFRSIARNRGLAQEEVCFMGFVPEADLVAFYSTCDVFFFPSLYEGLGLPVLEAMACGAPVICGDNSSLIELADRKDAVFDASNPASITERLNEVLSDDGFANDLRQHGRDRAKNFTWKKTATRALEAFDEVLRSKRQTGIRAAAAGWLPKPRLAMLTPLPPSRSGIADYNARFLPFLAAHFEIDIYVAGYSVTDLQLNSNFRIFDASDFRRCARSYDAILYEFGNSEFHAYMLPLLAEFPGIVGLHDAFLSGLTGYLEFNLGESHRYGREMLHAHGGQARRLFAPVQAHPDANGSAMVDLPCTKRVLEQAIGIISHSPFNLQVARTFHPEGWLAPYRIIPQMMEASGPWSGARVAAARAELGFGKDDFIIATFGHVAWTKCGDRLLQAFLNSELAQDATCHLVFAGELAKDDFGLKLNDDIRKSGLFRRIEITGFLSETDYERYLRIADVAVQLRTKSRGGTPRGVLDCLAHGLPVIVNNEASYEDYPDDVVVKLSSEPSSDQIASALLSMKEDDEQRGGWAERGREYVRGRHDPERCAAQYAAAIHELAARNTARTASHHAKLLAPHLAALPDPVGAARLAADYLDSRPVANFARPRLVIDVSHIAQSDHETGIPRVVKETLRACYCNARPGFDALAVERVGDHIVPATAWLDRQRLLLPHEAVANEREAVSFRAGDRLLMLDSSWAAYDEFTPVFDAARAAHVPIVTAIYDLLPITLPPGNIVEGGKQWFEGWLRRAIAVSDGLVCISRSVADEVVGYIRQHKLERPGLKVGWWHLGSTLPVTSDPPRASVVRNAATTPYALMVGTIEPRKNHELAVDSFERMWREGTDLNLVIAGKSGWLVDSLLERLRSHPQRNRKLFLFEQATDAEIAYLYRNAAMLLFLSKGEGFGLPLVEAAHYGIPIVCSNIPSFREIAGEHATYVGLGDSQLLSEELSAAWNRMKSGTAPCSSKMPRLTWDESTDALLTVLLDHRWYWKH